MKTNKKNYALLLLALCCLAFTACETDLEKMYVNRTNSVAPPLLKCEGSTEIVVNESNINFIPIELNWSKSDFGQDVLVAYSLEMATDASFDHSYTVLVGNNINSKELSCSELNKWVIANFNGLDTNDLPVRVDLQLQINSHRQIVRI